MVHGFNDENKEKVEIYSKTESDNITAGLVSGKIVTYEKSVTIPASTNSYKDGINLRNTAEASQYDHYMILGFEFIASNGNKHICPVYEEPTSKNSIPNIIVGPSDYAEVEMFNFTLSSYNGKFKINVLWYND